MSPRLLICTFAMSAAALAFPLSASAQQQQQQQQQPPPNVPPAVQQAQGTVEDAVRRFRVGVSGGVALDPELIDFGAHAAFAPVFHPRVEFRPGVEIGIGELTTMLAFNFDVLYTLPGAAAETRWLPYIGAGPSVGLSHRGFETENVDNIDTDPDSNVRSRNRFDFSDTDFNGGFNFIAGARNAGGTFFELKATAWGVSTIRLLAGFNF